MLTTREAARLLSSLARPGTPEPLAPLAAAIGFGRPLRVGRQARQRFGLEVSARTVAVASAQGPATSDESGLRALLVELHPTEDARREVARLARAVAREAPANLWMVIARDAGSGLLVIAAPAPGGMSATSLITADPAHIADADAETFAALVAHRADTPEAALLVHLRWRETLGRDALSRRFYRELERCVATLAATAMHAGRADARDRRTLALLFTSRLLFLAFLEAKGWLDADRSFLRRRFEAACGGRGAHHRLLLPLFFGTLNTPASRRAPAARAFGRVPFLNGGLFTRAPLERRHRELRFTDEALGDVIGGLLGRYRLTARETSAEWSDAAVDPEMLGRAFESLMSSADRKSSGTFYTPHALIVRLTRSALEAALPADAAPAAHGALPSPGVLAALDDVRLVDPACGSGAFLVHALEEIAELRRLAGDRRPPGERRRHVLTRSIFGVDIDPTAVWLCQLRLWLSVVVDDDTPDPSRLLPLPNLDRNVREGDALGGRGLDELAPDDAAPAARVATARDHAIESLRLRYARASGARKRTLSQALDRAERAAAIASRERECARVAAVRREILLAARSPSLFGPARGPDAAQREALTRLRDDARRLRTALRRLREGGALPFSFATHFPGVAARGGFSVVLGNPPWVRPHAMALTRQDRDALRERFVVYRRASWQSGAEAAGAGRAFSSQADLAAIFTERAVHLARPGGVIALLLPSKLWIALAGGGLREHLARHSPVRSVEDWSDEVTGFDAAVYPSALVARRGGADEQVQVTVHRRGRSHAWRAPRGSLAVDESAGAPWLLLPPAARAAYALLERAGVPLANSALGRPLLGVKSGCNEAFVVEHLGGDSARARVRSGSVEGEVETALLRPLLRGEHLRAWRRAESAGESMIWTHDLTGSPLPALPPLARRWLSRWRRQLELRTDARGGRGCWWGLFRTESARSDRPRVAWGDIGRSPRALVLDHGDPSVPLNSCYVVRTPTADDAHALAALLNSDVVRAWLAALAEPARGGYRRFLGWTCARLPLPAAWDTARARLAPLGRAAAAGDPPSVGELGTAVLATYGLTRQQVAPLLAWTDGDR